MDKTKEKTALQKKYMGILVPCLICEIGRQKQPFLNINNSYPIGIITNIATHTGLRSMSIPAYLCESHYKEQFEQEIKKNG